MPRNRVPVAINVHLCPRDYETRKVRRLAFFGFAQKAED
jgi:hypothetical protein